MTFHWPYFFLLLVVPLVSFCLEFRRKKIIAGTPSYPKILQADASANALTLQPSSLRSGVSNTTTTRLRWRLYLGLVLLVAALARPQWGHLDEPVFDQAREIVIALDLSRSMLTPDVRPSRLERAKLLVTSLLQKLEGERVGLIVFAGTSFLQSPLSSDYEVLNEFLPSLTPDYLPEGGTNYSSLIGTAIDAFGESGSSDRYLIILSDGEATDENWRGAVENLRKKNVRVIGLGVGTSEGAIIPDGSGGFVKDERGAVVLSKLESATLKELATATHGAYADASAWIDLAQILKSTVEAGQKGKFREERQSRLVERFQWVLGPAFVLLLFSFWREFPVRPRPREISLRAKDVPPPPPPSQPPPLPRAHMTTAAVKVLVPLAFAFFSASTIGKVSAAIAVPGAVNPLDPKTSSSPAGAEPSSPSDPLSKLVTQLSARPELNARDYGEIAQSTVTYGKRMQTAQQPVVESSIQDGLAAVEAGERLDHKAADWPALREELAALLRPKPTPTPTPPSDKKDDKKDQNKQDKSDSSKDSKSENQKNEDPSQKEQKDEKPNEAKDKSDPNSDSKKSDAKPASNQQSAFGDMKKPAETPPNKPENSATPETQKVGGEAETKAPEQPVDPSMVVPLQRLQQVKNQDSSARLQQILRGDKQPPASGGKNW